MRLKVDKSAYPVNLTDYSNDSYLISPSDNIWKLLNPINLVRHYRYRLRIIRLGMIYKINHKLGEHDRFGREYNFSSLSNLI